MGARETGGSREVLDADGLPIAGIREIPCAEQVAGGILDETVDLPRTLMRIAAFFRNESCGQCVPCRVGTVRQQEALARLISRRTRGTVEDELALIAEMGQCMRDASICGLGQTASSAIESAIGRLHVFGQNGR